MIKLLFFDTETTGLPQNYNRHFTELDNWPRLVQIAFLLYDESGSLLSAGDYIVKPFEYYIPPDVSLLHGISNERALSEGLPCHIVLGHFLSHVIKADYIIAHNFKFDFNIVGAEAARIGIAQQYGALFNTRETLCTKETTGELCQIKQGTGYKPPKLQELHKFLFGTGFDNAHNAMADVKATARCFFELKKKGFYKIIQEQYVNFVVLLSFASSVLLDFDTVFDFI